MRRACKKDTTHDEIKAEFERLGCAVLNTFHFPGFVDMLVWRHETRWIEAKSKNGSLRPSQRKLAEEWPGPIYVVRSAMEARALVQCWDREERHQLPWSYEESE